MRYSRPEISGNRTVNGTDNKLWNPLAHSEASFEFTYQIFFRDKAISDIQPPGPSPRNSHFLSVNNKTLVGAGDLGGESEKLKLADNKYENQLNALRLEEMFKNVFNGATHQDIINLKAQKYTQD